LRSRQRTATWTIWIRPTPVVLRERHVAAVTGREHAAAVELLDGREEVLLALAVEVLAAELGVGVLLHDDVVVVELFERLHRTAREDCLIQLLVQLTDVARALTLRAAVPEDAETASLGFQNGTPQISGVLANHSTTKSRNAATLRGT
jgi:hypothetical protein